MARGSATEQPARTPFREVFAVAEFRALWMAQLLSVVGDQLARVALTVLVYDRTRSALLAAITFAVTIVPTFIGGVTLAWLADRYPRRAVMITCDIVRGVIVLVMVIPGLPLAALVALLFLVTLIEAPFTAARAAIFPDVLSGDRYVMGTAVTLTTYQFAQVLGFAVGGAVVALFGTRTSLLVDALTVAGTAHSVRIWVSPRRHHHRERWRAGLPHPQARCRTRPASRIATACAAPDGPGPVGHRRRYRPAGSAHGAGQPPTPAAG